MFYETTRERQRWRIHSATVQIPTAFLVGALTFALLSNAQAASPTSTAFPPNNVSSCNAGTMLNWSGPGTDTTCIPKSRLTEACQAFVDGKYGSTGTAVLLGANIRFYPEFTASGSNAVPTGRWNCGPRATNVYASCSIDAECVQILVLTLADGSQASHVAGNGTTTVDFTFTTSAAPVGAAVWNGCTGWSALANVHQTANSISFQSDDGLDVDWNDLNCNVTW